MGDEATGSGDGSAAAPDGIDQAGIEAWFALNVPERRARRSTSSASPAATPTSPTASPTPAATSWALRRPPLGKRLGSAHDMGREHKVVSALGADRGAGGAGGRPLRGRERQRRPLLRDGVRRRARSCAALAEAEVFPDEGDRRAIGERVADTLAAIHAVDPDAVGLGDLGRKEDYVARQLRRWQGQWEKSKTRELPPIDRVHERLAARIPAQGPATIVHGDYRLDNMILTAERRGRGGRRLGALHARRPAGRRRPADGLLARPRARQTSPSASPPTSPPASRPSGELAARYAERSGRDLADLDFFVALGYWKLAIILEGVYARYAAGGYGKVEDGHPRLRPPGRATRRGRGRGRAARLSYLVASS